MSTQFDQVFDGLSTKSLSLEDACRALYSELQASPESMRVCCERIEIELSRGRITSDAAQLLLDALGEHGMESAEDPQVEEAQVEEVWVDVPLEPIGAEAPRAAASAKPAGGESITEVDLTMDDLLAALDRRGAPPAKTVTEVDFDVGDELAAPVEWVEWEPEVEAAVDPAPAAVVAPLSPAMPPVVAEAAPLPEPAAEVAATADAIAPEVELAVPEVSELDDAAVSAELEMAALVGQPAAEAAVASTVEQATPVATVPAAAVETFDDAFAEIEAAAHEVAAEPQPTPTAEAESALAPVEQLESTAPEAIAAEADTETAPLEPAVEAELSATVIVAALTVEPPKRGFEEPLESVVASEAAAAVDATNDAAPAGDAGPVATASEPASLAAAAVAALPTDSDTLPEASAAGSGAAVVEMAPRVEHLLRESTPPEVGALVNGRYRIVGALESGGLGPLLEAVDTLAQGEPRVTLKLIEVDWQEEPRAFETLQAIVRHVRRLRHPNVLSILDIDRDQQHAIIALEPLRGRWLSGLLREVRGRGVGFAVAWNIISGVANGLAYAHQHGAVHTELNPHMIFLSDDGGVKIAGFGLAHALPMSSERLDVLDGLTLRSYADVYSATNWIHGSTAQSVDDLYPLGAMAYELLTGAHPFRRLAPAAAAAEQLRPSAIPGLDRRIRRVIERCLSFNRQERPANGANFLAHVQPSEQLLDLVRERFNRPA